MSNDPVLSAFYRALDNHYRVAEQAAVEAEEATRIELDRALEHSRHFEMRDPFGDDARHQAYVAEQDLLWSSCQDDEEPPEVLPQEVRLANRLARRK